MLDPALDGNMINPVNFDVLVVASCARVEELNKGVFTNTLSPVLKITNSADVNKSIDISKILHRNNRQVERTIVGQKE